MNKMIAVAIIATLTFCGLAAPAVAAATSKFWVNNDSDYEIVHVYVQSDNSGGQRDLMGANGIIPPWDQAVTLRPRSDVCRSRVGIVAYDQSDETESWVWFRNVNICSPNTTLTVENDDFTNWN